MRIGLDARIASYNSSGISRYFWGLVSGLEAIPSDFDFTVFLSKKKSSDRTWGQRFSTRTLVMPPHNIFEQFVLPLEMASSGCDLIHGIDFYSPVGTSRPQVLSVYDLYFLKSPECLDRASLRHYSKVVRYAESASHVICSSESTRQDLLSLSRCKSERVSVIYPGLFSSPTNGRVESAIQAQTAAPFILFVGTVEPRKNLTRLFEAYKRSRERVGKDFPRLLLAGGKGFAGDRILAEVRKLNLEQSVIYLGAVSEAGLSCLYEKAEFVVYPSLYEGFGFPIVEAMAAKKAVLSSNISSIPEVASGAALLVDPLDIDALARGLERLATDADLRRKLVEQGQARVKDFSWTNAAKQTLAVYEKAVGI